MGQYVIRRILLPIPTLIFISFVIFAPAWIWRPATQPVTYRKVFLKK